MLGSGEAITVPILYIGCQASCDARKILGRAQCWAYQIWCGAGLGSGLAFGGIFASVMSSAMRDAEITVSIH